MDDEYDDYLQKVSDFGQEYQVIIKTLKSEEGLIETGEILKSSELIQQFIYKYSSTGIYALTRLVRDRLVSTTVAGEILRQIGEIDRHSLKEYAVTMISKFLDNPSLRVRDGAIMGLSNIGMVEAIPYLEYSHSQEKDEFIKYVIVKTIASIKARNIPNPSSMEIPPSSRKDTLMTYDRRPEDVKNLTIHRDEDGRALTFNKKEDIKNDFQIPIKFPPGTLTSAEFVTLQAAGEQLARIILNQLGNPKAVQVSSAIDLSKDEEGRTIGFVITLKGNLEVGDGVIINNSEVNMEDIELDDKEIF